MTHLFSWIRANPYAAMTICLLAVTALAGWVQAFAARKQATSSKLTVIATERAAEAAQVQAEIAERGLAIAERAALTAEQQLAEARTAARVAGEERESANRRADLAEERSKLAHEQMKAALAPHLVLLRIQNTMGQKFFIENQGQGFAVEITWDYAPPKIPADGQRLFRGFSANMLAHNAKEEFFFDYNGLQMTGILFRYSSQDGRVFWSHVTLVSNGNGAFRHSYLSI